MADIEFTLDELLEELMPSDAPLEGFRSSEEWSVALGVGVDKARKILRNAQSSGRLAVKTATYISLDGRTMRKPVYAILPKQPSIPGITSKT